MAGTTLVETRKERSGEETGKSEGTSVSSISITRIYLDWLSDHTPAGIHDGLCALALFEAQGPFQTLTIAVLAGQHALLAVAITIISNHVIGDPFGETFMNELIA